MNPLKRIFWYLLRYITLFKALKNWSHIRGPLRGGSGGSIDPPRILENIIKEVKIELLSWIFGILTPLCVIPSILTPLSKIPNRASGSLFLNFSWFWELGIIFSSFLVDEMVVTTSDYESYYYHIQNKKFNLCLETPYSTYFVCN